MLKHWEKLTLFLRQPGAPLDSNIVERALKKAIPNSLSSFDILVSMPRERTKIRSDNVVPEILEILKREKQAPKATIEQRMRDVAEQKGLGYRPQAVSYGLRALKNLGWVSNANGIWSITDRGMQGTLTDNDVQRLGRIMYP